MKALARWSTADGVYTASITTDMFKPIEHGFRCAFVAMPEGAPDLFVFVGLGGQATLLVANGRISRPAKTLSGMLDIDWSGTQLHVDGSIPDGTARVLRITDPGIAMAYKPMPAWDTFVLRDTPPVTEELVAWFIAYNAYFHGAPGLDLPKPDVAGSPRVCQYLWPGAIGPALLTRADKDVPSIYRAAALDWTDQQFNRPVLYYDDAGKLMRHADHQDVWIDQIGWRKGLHGKIDRTSASVWTLDDSEHLAIDRQLTAAMGWMDPAAWLLLDAWGEALLSRPLCHGPKLASNQREIGYTLRTMALLVLAWGDLRPQFRGGLERARANLQAAFGFASGRPYPSIAPPHTGKWSHGYPNKQDTENWFALKGWPWPPELDLINDGNDAIPWLQAKALADGKGKHSYTVGDGGLFTYLRAVVVWETAVMLNGLVIAGLAGDFTAELVSQIRHVAACILGPGREAGIGQDQSLFSTPTFHDSYAAIWPWRKTPPTSPWTGTTTWIAPALAMAAPYLPTNLHDEAIAAARELRDGTTWSKLPAESAVSTFWPAASL